MLYCNRTNVSKGIGVNKPNKWKEYTICHYWCFSKLLSIWARKYCNTKDKRHYSCIIWNMTRNDAINILNNSKLEDKGSSWIWILVQIKHLLK